MITRTASGTWRWKCEACGTAGLADSERAAIDELTHHEQRAGH